MKAKLKKGKEFKFISWVLKTWLKGRSIREFTIISTNLSEPYNGDISIEVKIDAVCS